VTANANHAFQLAASELLGCLSCINPEGMLSEIVILLQLYCTTPFHRAYAMLPITEIGKGIVNQV